MNFNFDNGQFENQSTEAEKPAVITANESLTWMQLQESSERLSSLIRKLKIPAGHAVLIYGNEQASQVAALTACVSVGCIFVPVTAQTPPERLLEMKVQISSDVIICIGTSAPDEFAIQIEFSSQGWSLKKTTPANCVRHSVDILYIIFTSGSTGTPKAVPITRRNMVGFLEWFNQSKMKISKNEVCGNYFSMGFDGVFILQANALAVGATFAHVRSSEYPDNLPTRKLTTWSSTPSGLLRTLLSPSFNTDTFPDLKKFILCGELFRAELASRIFSAFPAAEIWNTYGPTEATVCVTSLAITRELVSRYSGLPISSEADCKKLLLMPTGETIEGRQLAEIEIVGDTVGPGYLIADGSVKDRFYSHFRLGRTYRTGDLGYLRDGFVFFYGRSDLQVKLHGYRIELSEIESRLVSSKLVSDCACVALSRNEQVKKILCFYTSVSHNKVSAADLRSYLAARLPAYMVPAEFIDVREIPLNKNSKVDRELLIANYEKGIYSL